MNDKIRQILEDLDFIQGNLNSSINNSEVSDLLQWSEKWQNKKNQLNEEIWKEFCKKYNIYDDTNIDSIQVGSLIIFKPKNLLEE